jgi:hypothetical protein
MWKMGFLKYYIYHNFHMGNIQFTHEKNESGGILDVGMVVGEGERFQDG